MGEKRKKRRRSCPHPLGSVCGEPRAQNGAAFPGEAKPEHFTEKAQAGHVGGLSEGQGWTGPEEAMGSSFALKVGEESSQEFSGAMNAQRIRADSKQAGFRTRTLSGRSWSLKTTLAAGTQGKRPRVTEKGKL